MLKATILFISVVFAVLITILKLARSPLGKAAPWLCVLVVFVAFAVDFVQWLRDAIQDTDDGL